MDTLFSWLIRSVLISGLMLGYYAIALRNRKAHGFNRVWLLTALLAGVVLPLIPIHWLTWHTASRKPLEVLMAGVSTHANATSTFPVLGVAVAVCCTVSVALLAILGFRIASVYRLKRRHLRQLLEGCWLIEVSDRRAPFSFLNNLFWREGADIDDPVQRKILDHELAHIRGGHTYDTLVAQTVAAVVWMNPFNWLIRRELQMVHEFIADDASIAMGDTDAFARMLLGAYDGGRYLDPSHPFYFSPIKRRLRMISSSKPPSGLWKALALPVLLAAMVLACSKEQSTPPAQAQKSKFMPFIMLKQLKIMKDSLDVATSDGLKKVFIIGKVGKNGQAFRVTIDSLGGKAQLDLGQAIEIQGTDNKVPPSPTTVKAQITND